MPPQHSDQEQEVRMDLLQVLLSGSVGLGYWDLENIIDGPTVSNYQAPNSTLVTCDRRRHKHGLIHSRKHCGALVS